MIETYFTSQSLDSIPIDTCTVSIGRVIQVLVRMFVPLSGHGK